MKGRIIGTLFALPFFGVGVWMLWSVGNSAYESWEMRGWQPTPAQLTSAGYTTNSGDDSNTYEAYAEYTYQYFGQTFSGNRVSLSSGSDNIGDYQQYTGRQPTVDAHGTRLGSCRRQLRSPAAMRADRSDGARVPGPPAHGTEEA